MKARSIMFHDLRYHEAAKMSFLFHLTYVENILTYIKDGFCRQNRFLSKNSYSVGYFNIFIIKNFSK